MELIRLHNVSKRFKLEDKSSFLALDNINVNFPSTGMHFIKGKSGSGKSTLLNLIGRVEKQTTGEIYYKDQSINKIKSHEYFNYEVSYVFQHYNLFEDLTGYQNVVLPLEIRGKHFSKKSILKYFDDFSISYLKDKKISEMSGGEKQRIAILRAVVTNSSVILCDEPTGALDSQNSVIIMDILKKLSKDKLVIVVSHNNELIEKYSDRTITLSDGRIISDTGYKYKDININKDNNSKVKGSKWLYRFSKSNLKHNFLKNSLCFLSSIIGLSATILSIGFSYGSNSALLDNQKKSLDYKRASIQEKSYQDIEGSPLSLVKVNRPEFSKTLFINDYLDTASIEVNFESILPQYPNLTIDGEIMNPCQFIPVFDITLSNEQRKLIVDGKPPIENNLNSVIVNKEFVNRYFPNENVIGKEINIHQETSIKFPIYSSERSHINDKFIFDKDMIITSVVEEFSFMNSPKIYYSYVALRDLMINYKLSEISEYLETDYSCYDLANDDDKTNQYNGYAYDIYVQDDSEVSKLFNLIKSLSNSTSDISISSTCYTVGEAYNGLTKTFTLSMVVFIAIAFVGVMFIFGIVSFSNFIVKKKESAILTCLGAKKSSIIDIFTYESITVSLLASLFSFCISFPLSKLLNKFLFVRFGIKNIIKIPISSYLGISYFLPIIIISSAILISILSSYFPISFYKNFSLANELRDE